MKHPVSAPLLESSLELLEFLSLLIAEEFTDHRKVVPYDSAYFKLAPPADLGQSPGPKISCGPIT